MTKNEIKLIRSLAEKKNRRREGLFVAEGPKVVGDLMERLQPKALFATKEWTAQHGTAAKEISDDELRRASLLQHPQQVIGLFPLPDDQPATLPPTDELSIALDGVQDPGNVGTIIRLADWFGIRRIYCSPDTADAYNPKVVQATMGSLARVHIYYIGLPALLSEYKGDVYGTFLDGDDIYQTELGAGGLIVMGNEGNGISTEVGSMVSRRLLIPRFNAEADKAESLNVAIATAITCSEFRRRFSVKKS